MTNGGRTAVRRLAIVAALCSVSGCGSEAREASKATRTVHERIGDTLVVRSVGGAIGDVTHELVPELRIGVREGPSEYVFGSIGDLFATPAGGIIVWDGSFGALREYSAKGEFVRQIGRRGDGPGEYHQVAGLGMLRDQRLVLWDAESHRLHTYDSTGAVLSSSQVPSSVVRALHGVVVDTADRVFLMGGYLPPLGATGTGSVVHAVFQVDIATGAVIDTMSTPALISKPHLEVNFRRGPVSGVIYLQVPFAPYPLWHFSPLGYFVTGDGARYAVTLHLGEQAPLRIERDLPSVTVKPEERRFHEERLLREARSLEKGWRWDASPVPDRKAFFYDLFVDADGRVWASRPLEGQLRHASLSAEEASDEREATQWVESFIFDVFAPTGELLASLAVPPNFSWRYAYGDVLWGVESDEDDVPIAVRYRLIPIGHLGQE